MTMKEIKLKQIAITLGIAIVITILVPLIVDSAYEMPSYEKYCNDSLRAKPYKPVFDSQACIYDEYNNPEYNACISQGRTPHFEQNESGCQVYSYCDDCNEQFNKAQEKYNRNIIMIIMPLALIAVITGLYFSIDFIGAGFMFGGVLLLIYASVRSFSDSNKLLRIGMLVIDLLVLLWIGYKKLK